METLKKILKTIGTIIASIFLGIAAFFVCKDHLNTKDEKNEAEKAKEEKRNELEKKSADDIAADSPNPDTISSNIEREQEELRERVRNRLNKNIPGNRSSSDN